MFLASSVVVLCGKVHTDGDTIDQKDAFDARGIKYEYARGYSAGVDPAEGEPIAEAVALALAGKYDIVLLYLGLTDLAESEGGDRAHMRLPDDQLELVNALMKTGKKIVIVLSGGSPVELPFAGGVSAILNLYLPGQCGGEAGARLLFGEANPSGKLAETWYRSYADVPYGDEYSKKYNELYKESVFVGYRYAKTAKVKPAFPFGFGLSYTDFEYKNLTVAKENGVVTATLTVRNTGNRDGAEVVQLYVKNNEDSAVFKPESELRAFQKVYLKSGEEKTVTLSFALSELADGWYRGSCGAWGLRNQYGTQTKLYAQLEITDKSGNKAVIGTDQTWAWSNDGEIRFADNKDGEIIEAWRTPSYGGFATETKCDVTPVSSNNVPVTEHEKFSVQKVITTPSDAKVLDFGQNIAGYISFSVNAKKGQKIKLCFGEMFDENGEFTQKNFQCANKKRTRVSPRQQIEYYCKDGLNEYKTKFAIFGFQYVLIESDVEWKPEDFTAVAVYSDMEETLSFDSSNDLLNKLVEATRWSAKNNHADVPTDCPTRERHGWTGDAQIFCNTASYLFNYAPFARKYVSDMIDGQRKNGKFRQITPKGGVDFYMDFMDGSAGWSDAGVLIPYRIYKRYGDQKILENSYAAMKKYADFKIKTLGKWYPTAVRTGIDRKYKKYISNYGQSYGEWAEPTEVHITGFQDFACPHPEETTAYIVYMLQTMAEIARVLGKAEDQKRFSEYAEKAKIGYSKLIECPEFTLDTDRQAKLVRPLYMGLLDEKQTEFAKKRLIATLERYDWRLGTGFLSTPFILYVLEDINPEYAYRLLENEQMPGWLFMPKMNANTIWESWEGTQAQGGIASLDHYSKGAVLEWVVSEMCGIQVSGENEFTIAPKVGGHFTFAKCEYQSVYGKVKSDWRRENGKTVYRISVPANTTAKVILPDGEKTLSAGEYDFMVD